MDLVPIQFFREPMSHIHSAGNVQFCPVMKKLKSLTLRFRFTLLGAVLGLAAGYMYYDQVGCEDGCTITGDPTNSSLYGALMGGLLLSMIDDHLKKLKK